MSNLPSYIEDINESSENEICYPNHSHLDVIQDMEDLGFEYSNDLAKAMKKCHIKS